MNKLCDVCGNKIQGDNRTSFLCQLPKSVECSGINVCYSCNDFSGWLQHHTLVCHHDKYHFPVDLV